MAIADLFTRTATSPAEGRSAAPYRPYGARPAVAGEGLDALFAWVDEIAARGIELIDHRGQPYELVSAVDPRPVR